MASVVKVGILGAIAISIPEGGDKESIILVSRFFTETDVSEP